MTTVPPKGVCKRCGNVWWNRPFHESWCMAYILERWYGAAYADELDFDLGGEG